MAILKLLRGVDLDSNYAHTIDFDSLALQEAYFSGLSYQSTNKFLHIKDTTASIFKTFLIQQTASVLRCDIAIDEARKCNYLMFQNDGDTKWYYAFIKQTYYLNKDVTIVEYEIDVMQTFLFDFSVHSAYIEREHQDRWKKVGTKYNPIYNILPENLNLGDEVIVKDFERLCDYYNESDKLYLVWACFLFTQNDSGNFNIGSNAVINKFMGNSTLFACFCPLLLGKKNDITYSFEASIGGNTYTLVSAEDFLEEYSTAPYLVSCEILPYMPDTSSFSVAYNSSTHKVTITTSDYAIGGKTGFIYLQKGNHTSTEERVRDLGSGIDYVIYQETMSPNKLDLPSINYETKLLTYPYRYAQIIANNDNLDIKYENIPTGANIKGRLSFYAYVINQIYVEDYLGDETNIRHALIDRTINEYPIKTDAYIQYLYTQHAQAQNQMAMGLIKGGSQLGIGLLASAMGAFGGATGNPFLVASGIGMVASGVPTTIDAISSKLAKEDDLKTTPQELQRYGNDGTFGTFSKELIPTIYYLEIKTQYKEIVYNYFKLFGYKSNRFVPFNSSFKLRSRYYYNYVKTATIEVTLPYNKDYQDKIQQIFMNGVTFWHNREEMGSNFSMYNYTYENWEVSLL